MKPIILTIVAAARAAREINPIGAAAIFVVAYLSGLAGSLAALLIGAALLAGLYAARVVARPIVATTHIVPTSFDCETRSPFEQLTAAGLVVNAVQFKRPSPARESKQPAAK